MEKEQKQEAMVPNAQTPVYYVGIGASAGGLEALELFFKHMPADTNMSFVVIQHLLPDYKSMMNELLARHTKMNIHVIENGMVAQPNSIYLIPPRMNLSIYHGQLFLEEHKSYQKLNLPIDVFFRSLALDQEKKAIAVVLSGTGSDGALGVRAIKESGGMILVQDEYSAKFDGMPLSAIATGLADAILPAEKMAEAIQNYIAHPLSLRKETAIPLEMDELSKIHMILRASCGVDFSYYKESTLVRRIERRVQINRCDSLESYVLFLRDTQKEQETLYRELLIGVTGFFRDKEAFNHLYEKVLPLLNFEKKTIRIWSAACSTGEEVYSLAILFKEFLEKNHIDCEVKIFATDIDRQALDTAGRGQYPDGIIADVDPTLLAKYFSKNERGYEIRASIRNMVLFARHDVLKDPPFSKLDLLVCRNLFIYFKPDLQQRVLSMFYYALNQGGYLFMGSAESIGEMSDGFQTIDARSKIFQQKDGAKVDLLKGFSLAKSSYEGSVSRGRSGIEAAGRHKMENVLIQALSISLPPSVILDENANILEVVNDMGPFIRIKSGRFSNSVYSNLPDDLALFVNNIMRRLKAGDSQVVFDNILGIDGFENKTLRLVGQALEVEKSRYFLLSFEAYDTQAPLKTPPQAQHVVDIEYEINERVKQLEQELLISKETLQAIVEELETSNEELQSSNEELIASNEELQSTNEELQSVNEELYSVNNEHQSKIEELVRLNNDLSNLMKNTEIGALYLDKKLCIRKTNPKVAEITNIQDSDIGRPISHITVMEQYPDFIEDINQVVEHLRSIDREMSDKKGRTWLARIRPYRDEYNAVEGIIITFVDITSLKSKEIALEYLNRRLDSAMQYGNIAWWEWDVTTEHVEWDPKKATMLGYTVEEFPTNAYQIFDLIHPGDYNKTMQAITLHLEGKTDSWDLSYRIRRKDQTYAWYYDRGRVTQKDEQGHPLLVVGAVVDISKMKALESQISDHCLMISALVDASPVAMVQMDSQGDILYANCFAQELFGLDTNEITRRHYHHAAWVITDRDGREIPPHELPFSQMKQSMKAVFDYRHFIEKGSGERIEISISGIPLLGSTGVFDGALIYLTIVRREGGARA